MEFCWCVQRGEGGHEVIQPNPWLEGGRDSGASGLLVTGRYKGARPTRKMSGVRHKFAKVFPSTNSPGPDSWGFHHRFGAIIFFFSFFFFFSSFSFSFPPVPILLDQTVGGAISTGSHGSSLLSGTLSDAVEGLTLVDMGGSIRRLGCLSQRHISRHTSVGLGCACVGDGGSSRQAGGKKGEGGGVVTGEVSEIEQGGGGGEEGNEGGEDGEEGGRVEEEVLRASRLACGRLGVIAEIALKTEKLYYVRQESRLLHVSEFLAAALHCTQGLHEEFRHLWAHFRVGASEVRVVGLKQRPDTPFCDAAGVSGGCGEGGGGKERSAGGDGSSGGGEGGGQGGEWGGGEDGGRKGQEGEGSGGGSGGQRRQKIVCFYDEFLAYDGRNWFPFEPPPPLQASSPPPLQGMMRSIQQESGAGGGGGGREGEGEKWEGKGEGSWLSMQYSFPLEFLRKIMEPLSKALADDNTGGGEGGGGGGGRDRGRGAGATLVERAGEGHEGLEEKRGEVGGGERWGDWAGGLSELKGQIIEVKFVGGGPGVARSMLGANVTGLPKP